MQSTTAATGFYRKIVSNSQILPSVLMAETHTCKLGTVIETSSTPPDNSSETRVYKVSPYKFFFPTAPLLPLRLSLNHFRWKWLVLQPIACR